MSDALLTPRPTLRIGRSRTLHLPRVLIEPPTGNAADQRVVLRTRCGLDPIGDGFTETYGIATCEACERGESR